MRNCRWSSLLGLVFFLVGCGKSLPELKGIDTAEWKSDTHGCLGKRTSYVEAMRSQKNTLLGLSEIQVVEMLGNPDRNELYKRNQKFYYYYLQPDRDCPTPQVNPLRLSIRFNAMGLAKEVLVD